MLQPIVRILGWKFQICWKSVELNQSARCAGRLSKWRISNGPESAYENKLNLSACVNGYVEKMHTNA